MREIEEDGVGEREGERERVKGELKKEESRSSSFVYPESVTLPERC